MKKAIIIIVIVVVAIGSIDPYSTHVINSGFKDKKPDKCLSGALLKQRMFQHKSALNAYKKIIKKFPDFKEIGKCHYYVAYCYEKTDRPNEAMEAYNDFINRYPKNEFAEIAKKRLTQLKINTPEQ